MELIKPNFSIITDTNGGSIASMMKFITKCGYTCYKTNKEITDDVAVKFVDSIIKSGHLAVLEHGTVFLAIPSDRISGKDSDIIKLLVSFQNWTRYTEKIIDGKPYLIIITNFRIIVENNLQEFMKRWWYTPTKDEMLCRPTVKYVADIHFYKDCTRHRMFSWCIESTRYCNYSNEKFGHSVMFMMPSWIRDDDIDELEKDCRTIENLYFKWLSKGYNPECAAYFLSQGVKADVIMTGFADDWKHFFNQRALGNTGRPHPDVMNLAYPLYKEFVERGIIDKIEEKK